MKEVEGYVFDGAFELYYSELNKTLDETKLVPLVKALRLYVGNVYNCIFRTYDWSPRHNPSKFTFKHEGKFLATVESTEFAKNIHELWGMLSNYSLKLEEFVAIFVEAKKAVAGLKAEQVPKKTFRQARESREVRAPTPAKLKPDAVPFVPLHQRQKEATVRMEAAQKVIRESDESARRAAEARRASGKPGLLDIMEEQSRPAPAPVHEPTPAETLSETASDTASEVAQEDGFTEVKKRERKPRQEQTNSPRQKRFARSALASRLVAKQG